jgi:predicted enzyme related to lactoylglutathione lyase
MPDYPPGTPMWVDLGTPDVEASIRFYGDLFGWSASDPVEGGGGYRFFEQAGKMVAGLGPLMAPQQPTAWTSYVAVADADATVAQARDAGGMVFSEPLDVMDVGRMAIVADPSGAALGLWQPRRHTGAEIVNEPVSLTWNELDTRDTEAAKPFYKAIFGWDAQADDAYTTWQLDGRPVAGMMAMPPQVPAAVPSYWLAYFAVEDTDAVVASASELGAQVLVAPRDIDAGRFAVLADPQGATFGVIRM